jgi:hypothetical protein
MTFALSATKILQNSMLSASLFTENALNLNGTINPVTT